jgi:hypothetical protein
MSKCSNPGQYPECGSCLNREFDPFQCEDCEDASNYEPDEDGDLEDQAEDMTLDEFRSLIWLQKVAA